MSQGLHLSQRLSQQMVLSPQLQQSLALLQAPVLELKAMIEQELQQNPVLEEAAVIDTELEAQETRGDGDVRSADPAEPPPDVQYDPATERQSSEPVDKFDEDMQKLLRLDEEWRDHFAQTNTVNRVSEEDEERRQHMFDSLTGQTSLQEHLIEQVRHSEIPVEMLQVAELIIGNIDERGYLTAKPEELTFSTGVPTDQIVSVLKIIQTFEPAGVGARDLRECLMIQLERANETDSYEYAMLRDHMDALGKRRFPEIARHLDISAAEAQEAAGRIAQLDPRPGSAFTDDGNQYVVAEITVERDGDNFVISSNSEFLPHLRISNTYKDLLSRVETSPEDREYIRDKIKAGKFLIKSLHQRQSTILNIANEIVKRQHDFFDKGVAHLKPMTMAQIAEVVGVHETTVSRAVSGKYMRSPQGIFEMKYFFTTGVATSSGENMSNTSVKNILSELIQGENRTSPLSDEELVARLKAQGIMIARRTVAKYRAELGVLPSHLRRSY